MIRTGLMAAVIACALVSGSSPVPAAGEGWTRLFNGKDLSGWRAFVDPGAKGVDPGGTWSVAAGELVCTGKPTGYLATEREYGNYALRLEWRWGDGVRNLRGPNSGVILHVSPEDRIWPKGVEAQLASTRAGDFWIVDGFRLLVDPARQDLRQPGHVFRIKVNDRDEIERPLGEWNQCEITCLEDTVRLIVNGHVVNEGREAELRRGRILLQSEGTEVRFRNIELKQLK